MKKFIIRMTLFLLFSLVAPCIYLIVRFNLFKADNRLKIGIAEIIVIGIFLSVLVVLIKYYLDGLKTKYSMVKQILQGVIKLILPLCLFLAIIIFLQNNVDIIKQALYVIIPCEFIAIIVNPLPKWCFDNNVEGMGEIFDKIVRKKE